MPTEGWIVSIGLFLGAWLLIHRLRVFRSGPSWLVPVFGATVMIAFAVSNLIKLEYRWAVVEIAIAIVLLFAWRKRAVAN